jgi:Holliday junction resolvase
MSNKNYVKGANFERKIKKFYEGLGYLVFRTAGSHSPADLIAFPPLGNMKEWQPMLIQCKATDKVGLNEMEELKIIALKYCLVARLAKKTKTGIEFTWIVRA